MEDVAELRRSRTDPFLSAIVPAYEEAGRLLSSRGPLTLLDGLALRFDRTPAISMHGWGWEFAVEEQSRALPHELARGKPAFIYVAREVRLLIEQRSPETSAFLTANYTLIKEDPFGSFHRRRTN